MILRDSNRQVLTCSLCDEQFSVTRRDAANPETMAIKAEEVAYDHRECEQYPNDLPRARRERGYRKRMEREFRRLQNKGRLAC